MPAIARAQVLRGTEQAGYGFQLETSDAKRINIEGTSHIPATDFAGKAKGVRAEVPCAQHAQHAYWPRTSSDDAMRMARRGGGLGP